MPRKAKKAVKKQPKQLTIGPNTKLGPIAVVLGFCASSQNRLKDVTIQKAVEQFNQWRTHVAFHDPDNYELPDSVKVRFSDITEVDDSYDSVDLPEVDEREVVEALDAKLQEVALEYKKWKEQDVDEWWDNNDHGGVEGREAMEEMGFIK